VKKLAKKNPAMQEKIEEWTDAELDEFEKLCAPLVKYLQTNHKRIVAPYSAILIQWDGALLLPEGAVYVPFKVSD